MKHQLADAKQNTMFNSCGHLLSCDIPNTLVNVTNIMGTNITISSPLACLVVLVLVQGDPIVRSSDLRSKMYRATHKEGLVLVETK